LTPPDLTPATTGEDDALSRPQRRLLRRIFNGRTVPLLAAGKPFLTYKDATRHLLALGSDERDAAYAQMKEVAGRAADE
jgi:hypothetical protein